MFYLPVGLAPRMLYWPWISLLIAVGFFVASLMFGPQTAQHQERILKLSEKKTISQTSRWKIPSNLEQNRQKQIQQLLNHDPKLSPMIYQGSQSHPKAIWITPWIIPDFTVMIVLTLCLALFGGFIENRIGSVLFGASFLALYYLGYFAEALILSSKAEITLGGSTGLYILAGAYLALFPFKDFALWKGEEVRPYSPLPVWVCVCLGLITLEALKVGGYVHLTQVTSYGYFHFVVLPLSYFTFRFIAGFHRLNSNYLSHAEVRLEAKLSKSSGNSALQTIKKLIALNPANLEPLDVYYHRVIGVLGENPISPENQKFLDKYLNLLVVYHYDKKDFQSIVKLLAKRPKGLMRTKFYRLLDAREALKLAKYMDQNGEWLESVCLYATMIGGLAQAQFKYEVLKRAEVLIHGKFKEVLEKPHLRNLTMSQANTFLDEYPNSMLSKILLDHIKHFNKVSHAS